MGDPVTVPTTTIPPAPRHQDILLKLLIEEQRVLIEAILEVRDAIGGL
jgi:hypothetical protein